MKIVYTNTTKQKRFSRMLYANITYFLVNNFKRYIFFVKRCVFNCFIVLSIIDNIMETLKNIQNPIISDTAPHMGAGIDISSILPSSSPPLPLSENEPLFVQNKPFATITGKDANGVPKRYIGQLPKETLKSLFDAVYNSKKAIINSGMNSGKTYLTFEQKKQITLHLIPYFQNLHKEIFIIYAAPRLTLVNQVAKNMNLIQFSSNTDGKTSKEYTDLVIGQSYFEPVVTTFNNLGKLVNQVKKNAPKAKILLIVDEIHSLLDSSYMNLQETEQFIESGFIDFTVGFTATCYTEFEYFGYKILTIDRDFKPKRDFEFHIGLEGKTDQTKAFKAIQLASNIIKKRGFKTTLNYIKEVERVRIFKELLSFQFNSNNIYDLTGKSGKVARENNKFLVSVMENSEALINSHLIANKTLDVGVDIKKNLDCITYIGEYGFNVLNPTTYFQSTARARTFERLPIITIIPEINHETKDLINLDAEIRKIQDTCNILNVAYFRAKNKLKWIEDNTETSVSKFDEKTRLRPTGDNQDYIWFDKNNEKFKVYKYKVAEKRILQKAQNCTLDDIIKYTNQFYDAKITIVDTTDLSEAKVKEIAEATKEEKTTANETISKKLSSTYHLDILAKIICENSTDISLIRQLRANFEFDKDVMEGQSEYYNASNDLYQKVISKDKEDNEIETYEPNNSIFLAQNDLAKNLLQYANFKKVLCCDINGNVIASKFEEYQDTIKEAVFTLASRKLNQVFKLLSYAVFNRSVCRYGIDAAFFSKRNLDKSVLSVEQYKFDNALIKWITNGKYLNKKIRSEDLFKIYKKRFRNKKFSQKKSFETAKGFIEYLSAFFEVKTSKQIGNKRAILLLLRLSSKVDKRKQVVEMLKTLINKSLSDKNAKNKDKKDNANKHYSNNKTSPSFRCNETDNEGQKGERESDTKSNVSEGQKGEREIISREQKIFNDFVLENNIKFKLSSDKKEYVLDIDSISFDTMILYNDFLDKNDFRNSLDLPLNYELIIESYTNYCYVKGFKFTKKENEISVSLDLDNNSKTCINDYKEFVNSLKRQFDKTDVEGMINHYHSNKI